MRKRSLLAMGQDRLRSSQAVGAGGTEAAAKQGGRGGLASVVFGAGRCQTHLLGPNLLPSVEVGLVP